MTGDRKKFSGRMPEGSAIDVFYHQEHQTVVEVWGGQNSIAANVPGEGVVYGEDAASVLQACMDSDDVIHRRVAA